MVVKDVPPLPAGQRCTIHADIAEVLKRDPFISDLDTRIEWLTKRHKRTSHLKHYRRMTKTAEVAAA